MILRTFSNAGALRSEQAVQSPYIGGFNDTVAFDSDGGLVVCTPPLADYKIQQIIRMDAQNNVLYQKMLSAPKTVVDISGAQPSRMVQSRCTARRWPTPADCSPSFG